MPSCWSCALVKGNSKAKVTMDWNRDTPSRKYRLRRILAVWRNRSLASFLVRIRSDPKNVQTLLHHSDVKLTLQCYTHSISEDRMAAAVAMLTAIFSHAARQKRTESGLSERQFEFKSFTIIVARNQTG